jgi:hypothetical protein
MTGISAFLQLPKRTTLAECHYFYLGLKLLHDKCICTGAQKGNTCKQYLIICPSLTQVFCILQLPKMKIVRQCLLRVHDRRMCIFTVTKKDCAYRMSLSVRVLSYYMTGVSTFLQSPKIMMDVITAF